MELGVLSCEGGVAGRGTSQWPSAMGEGACVCGVRCGDSGVLGWGTVKSSRCLGSNRFVV